MSVTDGVKRFNSLLQKEPDHQMSTEQLTDVLTRFIRAEEVGDLWLVLKRNSNSPSSKDALLSTTEKLFFEFIYGINSHDADGTEMERWPGVFMMLAE